MACYLDSQIDSDRFSIIKMFRKPKFILNNCAAVITGAGSGIGRALAINLADKGVHLSLCDIDPIGLEQTRQLLKPFNVHIHTKVVDVSDSQIVKDYAHEVSGIYPNVRLLINNAGIALFGTFSQASEDDFDRVWNVNFGGIVNMTRVFLPYLRKQPSAKIVNISSIFGMCAPAGYTAYSASKYAIRGFTESLGHELEKTNVSVMSVHPGGVNTKISEHAIYPKLVTQEGHAKMISSFQAMAKMTPEQAAKIIVSGISNNKIRLYVGRDAYLLALISRLFPISHWKVLRRIDYFALGIEKAPTQEG